MQQIFPAVMLILIVGGFIGLIVYLWQKRQQEMQAIAQQLNLQYSRSGDQRIATLMSGLDFFSHGTQRRIHNLMQGSIKRQGKSLTVAIFDYSYTQMIHNPSEDDTFCQTVLLFYDESLNVPGFSLRPEHIMDKFANLIGCEDINFSEFPNFSKRYRLQGNQPHQVRSLFQPNLIKFFEGQKICTEAQGPYVVIFPSTMSAAGRKGAHMQGSQTFTQSQFIAPSEVKSYLDVGLRLLGLLERNAV
jgi:hypothetical protein